MCESVGHLRQLQEKKRELAQSALSGEARSKVGVLAGEGSSRRGSNVQSSGQAAGVEWDTDGGERPLKQRSLVGFSHGVFTFIGPNDARVV